MAITGNFGAAVTENGGNRAGTSNQSLFPHFWQCQNLTDCQTRNDTTIRWFLKNYKVVCFQCFSA